MGLLQRQERVALRLELTESFRPISEVAPRDTLLGTQSGLMNIGMRRAGRDPTEIQSLQAEGIRRPKDRANIIHTPQVIQHEQDRELLTLVVVLLCETYHLGDFELLHQYKDTVRTTTLYLSSPIFTTPRDTK